MISFNSFFMGGFECADHINRSGERINLLQETGHDVRVREDYLALSALGIKTVREGICWSAVETHPFTYDFTEVISRIHEAERTGIQQIWDMCHFGYPDGLIPTHPLFAERFAAVCAAFTRCYRGQTGKSPVIIPINEISFLAWHSGDMRGTVPFAVNSGFDIKYHLCRAAIKGIEAIKAEDPHAHIMHIEPLIRIHANFSCDPALISRLNEEQFQAMDIIGGYLCPELGGRPEFLETLGFNYYYNNQWVHNGETLCWQFSEQYEKFSGLLAMAYHRYGRPVILSETGHFGTDRARWMRKITDECIDALKAGVDLRGICIYPVIDRPDWDDLSAYCQCGIWDIDQDKNRRMDEAYGNSIIDCQNDVLYYLSQSAHETSNLTSASCP